MKRILNLIGILLILASGPLFLWGIYHMFWTADPRWVTNSFVMLALALGLLLWANRGK